MDGRRVDEELSRANLKRSRVVKSNFRSFVPAQTKREFSGGGNHSKTRVKRQQSAVDGVLKF
jgi:hypothetical protein